MFEDEDVVAFHDTNPQAKVHILIIPRKHIVSLSTADDSDALLLGKLMRVASNLAEAQGLHARGYRVVINTGRDAGQSVLHIHAHLLGGRPMGWPPG